MRAFKCVFINEQDVSRVINEIEYIRDFMGKLLSEYSALKFPSGGDNQLLLQAKLEKFELGKNVDNLAEDNCCYRIYFV